MSSESFQHVWPCSSPSSCSVRTLWWICSLSKFTKTTQTVIKSDDFKCVLTKDKFKLRTPQHRIWNISTELSRSCKILWKFIFEFKTGFCLSSSLWSKTLWNFSGTFLMWLTLWNKVCSGSFVVSRPAGLDPGSGVSLDYLGFGCSAYPAFHVWVNRRFSFCSLNVIMCCP